MFHFLTAQPRETPLPEIGLDSIDLLQSPLLNDEAIYIKQAVAKRKREFIAGRTLARLLLEKLSVSSSIGKNEDRSPCWPKGIVGSISHNDFECGVALGSSRLFLSIGLDIETIGQVKPELWPLLFVDAELASLTQERNPERRALLATLYFSAKEAFYKYQYPLTKQWVEFHAAQVTQLSETTFQISHQVEHSLLAPRLTGYLDRPTPSTLACLLFSAV